MRSHRHQGKYEERRVRRSQDSNIFLGHELCCVHQHTAIFIFLVQLVGFFNSVSTTQRSGTLPQIQMSFVVLDGVYHPVFMIIFFFKVSVTLIWIPSI